MEKCNCYHPRIKTIYINETRSTQRIVGHCWGTKECEQCSCDGNKLKCDFYDYIRERAKKEQLDYQITEAIKLLEANGYEVKKI